MADNPYKRGQAGPDQLPKGEAKQLNDSASEAKRLAAMGLEKLQEMYSSKEISFDQYNKATSAMFDQQMLEPQIDNLQAQGKDKQVAEAQQQLQNDQQFIGGQDRTPQGVKFDNPGQQQQAGPSLQGDDNLIFGPTGRPDEQLNTGLGPSGSVQMPQVISDGMPYLEAAASHPDAPPQLQQLVAILRYYQSGQ